jgi:hypothetical protein
VIDALVATLTRTLADPLPAPTLGVTCDVCGCLLRRSEVCPACLFEARGAVLAAVGDVAA